MNSKGIAEDAKCGRFCLTLGGDVYGINKQGMEQSAKTFSQTILQNRKKY